MERFRLSFLWSFVSLLLKPETMSAEVLFNSTLACTRGANQTLQELDCRNGPIKGLVGQMFIRRLFVGTPPLTSGCDRTAPYSKCCIRNNETDCIFATDTGLKDLVKKFNGVSGASFAGARMAIPPENCDPKIYPDLTSYSIMELGCVSVTLLNEITANVDSQLPGEVYLESNYYSRNTDVYDADFQCVAQTKCNSTVTLFALSLSRKVNSSGYCPEEFFFEDVKYSNKSGNVTCADGAFIFNQPLFTSVSNVVSFNMTVTGNHTGKVFIKAMSSNKAGIVSVACGEKTRKALDNIQVCPDDPQYLYETSFVVSSTVTTAEVAVSTTTISGINTASENEGLPTGTIVGIVLAIIAIVLVLALIIGIVLLKLRKNRKGVPPSHDDRSSDNDKPPPYNMNDDQYKITPQIDRDTASNLGGPHLTPRIGTSTVRVPCAPPEYKEHIYDEADEHEELQNYYLPSSPCGPVRPHDPNSLSMTNRGFMN